MVKSSPACSPAEMRLLRALAGAPGLGHCSWPSRSSARREHCECACAGQHASVREDGPGSWSMLISRNTAGPGSTGPRLSGRSVKTWGWCCSGLASSGRRYDHGVRGSIRRPVPVQHRGAHRLDGSDLIGAWTRSPVTELLPARSAHSSDQINFAKGDPSMTTSTGMATSTGTVTTLETPAVIGGVNTHKHTHCAAVVDETGRLLGQQFPAAEDSYAVMLAWMHDRGPLEDQRGERWLLRRHLDLDSSLPAS